MVPNQKMGDGGTVGSDLWDFDEGMGVLLESIHSHKALVIKMLHYIDVTVKMWVNQIHLHNNQCWY